jgi:NADH:ubiquinone oxidoreductase subunit 2 (subunit N)
MGFFAKWYVLQAALQAPAPQTILAVVLVVTSAISAAYYLQVISAMFMRPRPEGQPVPTSAPMAHSLIGFAAVTLIVLGLYPTPIVHMARNAVTSNQSAPIVPAVPAPRGPRLQAAQLFIPDRQP